MRTVFTHQKKIDCLNKLKTIQQLTKNGDTPYIYDQIRKYNIISTYIPVLKNAGVIRVNKKEGKSIFYIWNTIEPNIFMAEKTLQEISAYNERNMVKRKEKLALKENRFRKPQFDEECENQQKGFENKDEPKQQIIPIEKAEKMLNYSDIERLFGKPLSDFEMMDKGTNDKLKSLEKENDRLSNVVKELNKELVDVHAVKRQLEKQKETNKIRCFNVLWGVITIKW